MCHGPAAELRFDSGNDWVGVTYREEAAIALEDSELVFVGYGIVAPEKGWNDYAGIDMHGKTAVILVNDPDWQNESDEGPFNGRAMTYYGRWTYKYEEAARQGAAAALIVHDDFPASYGWNVVESSWSGPQVAQPDGGPRRRPDAGQRLDPARRTAETIARAAGQDLAAARDRGEAGGLPAVPLGLRSRPASTTACALSTSKNVIGILPGSERPDEYVIHTAHWDHLGHCTPNADGDDICNGAIDNAPAAPRSSRWPRPMPRPVRRARSLVFLALTAEEQGLLGSEYYAANPVFPLDQTVGGINMDGGSMAGPARDVTVIGMGKSQLDAVLARNLPKAGRVATPDAAPEAGYYYRSDHFSLAKRGVPMFNIEGGEDLVEGGRRGGRDVERRLSRAPLSRARR